MKYLFIILLFSFSYSQNITVDNNKDFEKALSFYNSKMYDNARNLFKQIVSRTENNSKVTASAFFV